ncbi:uncharacterized protein LOC117193086 isoform X2 [Drosophila miranda]|uniref:uncharacterized protein LOC117193086 isoform X2 n=1 Tax=Drosophila miranda TaxID=7229 RepID=UPI00143F4E4D|nr:uncharacterized protein LOC117193086 isoform X2 [Drosophila miranda]
MQKYLCNTLRLLAPPKCCFTQSFKNASNFLYERARAGENVHFLKIQREQLMKLRSKLMMQKVQVIAKIDKVDEQIERITAKSDEDQQAH